MHTSNTHNPVLKSITLRRALIAGLCFLLSCASVPASFAQEREMSVPASQMSGTVGDGGFSVGSSATSVLEARESGERRLRDDIVLAPIPGRSPQVGWSLAVAGGYFFGGEEGRSEGKPSIIGGFGWYAENDSYAFGVGGNLHLYDDNLRVKFGAGYMDVKYRYYGIGEENNLGISVNVLQEAPLYFGSASYRIWNKLYAGLGYMTGTVDSRLEFVIEDPDEPGNFFDPVLSLNVGAITVPVAWDSRDHEQFPQNGWLVEGRASLYRKDAGSDFDADIFLLTANKYISVRNQDVLAFRGYFRTTGGSAPFFLLSTFGGQTDLRGYPAGRYRDRMMYAVQGEYRWQFSDKWIFTGFAGVGEVAPQLEDFGDEFLPAAGLGARFVVSQKHRVSLSFDVARGKNDTEYYFGINEAF
jgi:hypothetical protein